jgi:Holliday junction DNA helicase RuvA
MQKWAVGRATPEADGGGAVAVPLPAAPGAVADAVSALVNLGIRRPEAAAAIGRAVQRLGDDAPLDALIRDGLKEMAR